MKLMQKGYNEIQSIEIELRILEQTSAPPSRPREYTENPNYFSTDKLTKEELDGQATIRIKRVRFVDEV